MDTLLLLLFAIPLATIILSIVLQKILNCPWLVAATFFAIFLIVTFIIGDIRFLIFVIIYTIISFITALIVRFICDIICGNGIMFRNINEQNINARRVNTNVLRAGRIVDNNNNDNDDDNDCDNDNDNNNNCNCNSCICNCRRRRNNCFCNCNNNNCCNNRSYSQYDNRLNSRQYRM